MFGEGREGKSVTMYRVVTGVNKEKSLKVVEVVKLGVKRILRRRGARGLERRRLIGDQHDCMLVSKVSGGFP